MLHSFDMCTIIFSFIGLFIYIGFIWLFLDRPTPGLHGIFQSKVNLFSCNINTEKRHGFILIFKILHLFFQGRGFTNNENWKIFGCNNYHIIFFLFSKKHDIGTVCIYRNPLCATEIFDWIITKGVVHKIFICSNAGFPKVNIILESFFWTPYSKVGGHCL